MDLKATFLEDRTIRMPQKYRELLGCDIGQFIGLKTVDNDILSLQVMQAFKEDLEQGEDCAYVTSELFNNLNINPHNECDLKIVNDITLGCDPEFFLISDKNIVPANRYFNKYAPVGSDGMLAEIRPAPSVDEHVVVNNIRKQLLEARARIDKRGHKHIRLHAASGYNGLTAGFHLHFGLPTNLLGISDIKTPVIEQIVRVLDYYVGMPCVLQEGIEDSQRRCATFVPYGKAGDYRLDYRTLEYRVAGGAMLKHPILTTGLLALGAVVIEDIISRVKLCTDNFANFSFINNDLNLNKLYPNVPSKNELVELVGVPGTEGVVRHIDKIVTDVGKMVGFNKRSASVENLFINLENKFSHSIDDNWLAANKELYYHEL
jgi:hypothetical protein